jgi:hypothetical protein
MLYNGEASKGLEVSSDEDLQIRSALVKQIQPGFLVYHAHDKSQ